MANSVDAPLSSAQRAKIRRLSQKGADGGTEGELNVVPYLDIVLNIVLFVLGGLSIVFVSSVDARAAEIGPGPRKPDPALRLSAFVTEAGVSLKTSRGNVAPGCEGAGAGITIPAKDGRVDRAALAACARRVKDAAPEFADETQITLTADPGIDTQTLVDVMDAVRKDDKGELFPQISFGVVR